MIKILINPPSLIKSFFKSAVDSIGVDGWWTIITIVVDTVSELIEKGILILLASTLIFIAAALESVLKLVVNLITGIVTWIWDYLQEGIAWTEELFYNFFDEFIPEIESLWTDKLWPFLEGVWDKIQEFGDWIVEGWADIIEEIGADLTSLKQTILNIWNGIKSTLTNAWNWLKTNIFDAIKNGVKSMLNSVISTINSLISKLNSISFTMPDWLGGGTFGLSIPTLPLLANGGYIGADMPTAAIIGDNKNEGEIVAPESKIQENVAIALEPYMSKIESLLSTLINSSDEIHVHCEIDGDEITEIVLNNANLATARGGA